MVHRRFCRWRKSGAQKKTLRDKGGVKAVERRSLSAGPSKTRTGRAMRPHFLRPAFASSVFRSGVPGLRGNKLASALTPIEKSSGRLSGRTAAMYKREKSDIISDGSDRIELVDEQQQGWRTKRNDVTVVASYLKFLAGATATMNTMTAPTSTTNAAPLFTTVQPIRTGTPPPRGFGTEENRVADTSAQGTTESPSASPTSPTGKVPWKDQVIAYAKKTRGAVLRKSTLKEHGDQILAGEASAWQPTRKE
ncbi:hypothetical protein H4582DRAFT_2054592 [Lactarius indigo]|nr:hypothetical protein H4582DRAFT_2054592 [Lactarius indigo]